MCLCVEEMLGIFTAPCLSLSPSKGTKREAILQEGQLELVGEVQPPSGWSWFRGLKPFQIPWPWSVNKGGDFSPPYQSCKVGNLEFILQAWGGEWCLDYVSSLALIRVLVPLQCHEIIKTKTPVLVSLHVSDALKISKKGLMTLHRGKEYLIHSSCIQIYLAKLMVPRGPDSKMKTKPCWNMEAQIAPWMNVGRSWMNKKVLILTAATIEME